MLAESLLGPPAVLAVGLLGPGTLSYHPRDPQPEIGCRDWLGCPYADAPACPPKMGTGWAVPGGRPCLSHFRPLPAFWLRATGIHNFGAALQPRWIVGAEPLDQ